MRAPLGAVAIAADEAGHEGAVAVVVVGVGRGCLVVVGHDAALQGAVGCDAAIHYRDRDALPIQIVRVGGSGPRHGGHGAGRTTAGRGRSLEIGADSEVLLLLSVAVAVERTAGVEADA